MSSSLLFTKEYADLVLKETNELRNNVLRKKYCFGDEKTIEDVQTRILDRFKHDISMYPETMSGMSVLVEDAISNGRVLPGGSILSSYGTDKKGISFSNCYTVPIDRDSLDSPVDVPSVSIDDIIEKLNQYGDNGIHDSICVEDVNALVSDVFYDGKERGIGEALTAAIRTFSYRGGVGLDISVLRPADATVNNSAVTSTGAVSFMPLFSSATGTIGQKARRGAMMITLDIRHPDALRFIWSKAKPEEVFEKNHITGELPNINNANISIKLTDEFMTAVEYDELWTFRFPDKESCTEREYAKWTGNYDDWEAKDLPMKKYQTVPARDVFRQLAEAAHMIGDPGVIFITTASKWTPSVSLGELFALITSNPCGEQIMSADQNCLLIAMVFSKYVIDPWTPDARLNTELFYQDVRAAVLFGNIVSDVNWYQHPLHRQRKMDKYSHRIGIEPTAIADMLSMLGMHYNSTEAAGFLDQLMYWKAIVEVETSCIIAQTNVGPCEALSTQEARDKFADSPYMQRLFVYEPILPILQVEAPTLKFQSLEEVVRKYGCRNTAWNTAGPTGSISIIAGNCSSGIEPPYSFAYTRVTMLNPTQTFTMCHYPVVKHLVDHRPELLENGITVDDLASEFRIRTAMELPYGERIWFQSVLQKWCDSSISSTINLPGDTTVDTVMDIYMTAWRKMLKGITIYRDGCKNQVLTAVTKHEEVQLKFGDIQELPDRIASERHIIYWKQKKVYFNVGLVDGTPIEVFIELPKEAGETDDGRYDSNLFNELNSMWKAHSRLISLLLRMGCPLRTVIKQLDKTSYNLTDTSAVFARILKKYTDKLQEGTTAADILDMGIGNYCPNCKIKAFVFESGCGSCYSCGHTSCG